MKIQIILNMQNPKRPLIAFGYEGWFLKLLGKWTKVEVVIHRGGNNYSVAQCKKEECDA